MLRNVVLLGGRESSFWEVKITYIRVIRGHARAVTAAIHHFRSDMKWDGSLMKSFAGLVQRLVVSWASKCFVEVGARIIRALSTTLNGGSEWQGIRTTQSEGHQILALGTPEQIICPQKVLCAGVENSRDEWMKKSRDFLAISRLSSTSTRVRASLRNK